MPSAEHLHENNLQLGYFVRAEGTNANPKSSTVNGTYLICCHFTFFAHDVATYPIRITMNGRGDGYNDYRVQVLVQFVRTNHHAGSYLLHFSTDGRVKVNPIDIILPHHAKSSMLSSVKTSGQVSLSPPSACCLSAASAHPTRLLAPLTSNLTKEVILRMASPLSSSGFISRSSSSRRN